MYLGITFSDQGTIAEDIRLHVESRLQDMRKNNVDNSVETDEIIKQYQDARRKLNSEYYKQHENRYRNLLNSDERKLWSEINWSGKFKSRTENLIHIDTMADYFENLYEPLDTHENAKFTDLHTYVYMPVTDDPITDTEIIKAARETKKGGYDYSLSVLQLFIGVLLPFFTPFFNMCFYISYPVKLAISMICAIPKKGNLKLAT